jgi:hypothetical protein
MPAHTFSAPLLWPQNHDHRGGDISLHGWDTLSKFSSRAIQASLMMYPRAPINADGNVISSPTPDQIQEYKTILAQKDTGQAEDQ